MANIILTGDVMLGRLVDEYVLKNTNLEPSYVWGNTLPLFLQSDLRLINLECVVSSKGKPWRYSPKVFHFRARPRAIEALKAAKIDFVSLANNHVLDFEEEALAEMVNLLERNKIAYGGAGENLEEALRPSFLKLKELNLAVISLTDNEPLWQAEENKIGINYVDYDRQGLKEPHLSRLKNIFEQTKSKSDLIVVSAHVGPNWGQPSLEMQTLAHQLIDLGADLYWGHSNHTIQGIEIYRGKPILYSTGDFIDDYAIDPGERNDLSFLFELIVKDREIQKLRMLPVKIENFQVNLIFGKESEWIRNLMEKYCHLFGTKPKKVREDKQMILELPLDEAA